MPDDDPDDEVLRELDPAYDAGRDANLEELKRAYLDGVIDVDELDELADFVLKWQR